MATRTVFLTGGTGFVGSNLAYYLLKKGNKVVFLVRSKKGITPTARLVHALRVIEPGFNLSQYEYEIVSGDITLPECGVDREVIEHLRGVEAILHCAGSVSFSEKDAERTWTTNVDGTRHAFEFASAVEAQRFHHISTAYIVGDTEGTAYEKRIPAGVHFNNPYEKSKFEAEELAWESGMSFSIYRLGVMIGDRRGRSLTFDGYYTYHRAFWLLKERLMRGLVRNSGAYRNVTGIHKQNGSLVLPLAIRCFSDSSINLVPVDWAAKLIVNLIQSDGLSKNEVFYITHPNPPLVQWVIETSLDILGVEGIRFVEPGAKVEHADEMLDKLQQVVDEGTKDYIPYATQVHDFIALRTKGVLDGAYELSPLIDRTYLERMLGYALERGFRDQEVMNNQKG